MRNFLALFVCSVLFLTGCESAMLIPNQLFEPERLNLTESSYSAADMLIQQSKAFVHSDTPLQIGMLTDMNNQQKITPFGRIVTNHIGARFVQLGYNVTTAPFIPPANIVTEKDEQMAVKDAITKKAFITGNYVMTDYDVLVNLRIVEDGSGRLLSAYDYSLPLTHELRSLTRPEGKKEEKTLFGF